MLPMHQVRRRITQQATGATLAIILTGLGLATGPSSFGADRTCDDFRNQASAQSFFLKNGGPALDTSGLDPDNDGLACEDSPAPRRGLLTIQDNGDDFSGRIRSLDPSCATSRTVKVRKGKKSVGAAETNDAGAYQVTKEAADGRFFASARKSGPCAGERSPTISVPQGRVEIAPAGVFFSQPNETKQLEVVGFGAQADPAPLSQAWFSSSNPAVISVTRSGLATAVVANGSAQIVAAVGGIESAPVLGTVTPLPDGAVPLTDEQIVGDPAETTPDAEPSFDNTLSVVLSGVPRPAVGTLLINAGSKPVIGRVRAVEDLGAEQFRVTLGQVGLDEAFPELAIDEVMDLSNAPVDINPDIAAAYDVLRTGDTFRFTPKPGGTRATAAPVPFSLRPFDKCEAEFSPDSQSLPVRLTAPPAFSTSINASLDVVSTAANGLERFVLKVEAKASIELGLVLTAAVEGKATCTAKLFVIRAPIPLPLGLLITGQVPVGVGFEAGGKLTVADVGVGVKAELKGNAEIGIACPPTPGGKCEFVRSLSFDPSAKPSFNPPSIGDLRLEPSLSAFISLKAAVGNPFLQSLNVDAFEVKPGARVAGSFATKTSQIVDTDYKSDYKVSLEATAALSNSIEDVIELFGLSSILGSDQKITLDVATSPTGTLTPDRANFVAGDRVKFNAELGSVDFFPLIGPYNVERVLLVRNSNGSITEVGSKEATDEQRHFEFIFNAPGAGSTNEFFLFVVTRLAPLDILALEIATAAVGGVDATGVARITAFASGSADDLAVDDTGEVPVTPSTPFNESVLAASGPARAQGDQATTMTEQDGSVRSFSSHGSTAVTAHNSTVETNDFVHNSALFSFTLNAPARVEIVAEFDISGEPFVAGDCVAAGVNIDSSNGGSPILDGDFGVASSAAAAAILGCGLTSGLDIALQGSLDRSELLGIGTYTVHPFATNIPAGERSGVFGSEYTIDVTITL
jgi:hypothetical protein